MHNTDWVTFLCVLLSIPKQANSGKSHGTKQNMHLLCLTLFSQKPGQRSWYGDSGIVV